MCKTEHFKKIFTVMCLQAHGFQIVIKLVEYQYADLHSFLFLYSCIFYLYYSIKILQGSFMPYTIHQSCNAFEWYTVKYRAFWQPKKTAFQELNTTHGIIIQLGYTALCPFLHSRHGVLTLGLDGTGTRNTCYSFTSYSLPIALLYIYYYFSSVYGALAILRWPQLTLYL